LAQVEVNIDYPEYDDVETLTTRLLLEKTAMVGQQLDSLLRSAKQGKILREGLKTAIIGRPNVGKSSLLNHLLQEDKAIVTEIAGTTRDVIEEYVNINGVPLKLIDTAGIRETDDLVEKIGVERSKKALDDAELILLVLNASENLAEQDKLLIKLTDNRKRIILLNKADLETKLDLAELEQLEVENPLSISVLNKDNLDLLELEISRLFFEAGDLNSQDATYLSNTRHIALIEKAKAALTEVEAGISVGMPVDIVQMDMTRCWDYLGEVVGDSVQDELITQLFSQFCLGK
jgi:tRNA modification GTPase